jgi:hypothetical protein
MVGRTDQDKLLLLSLLGKADGRSGIHDNLLPSLLPAVQRRTGS